MMQMWRVVVKVRVKANYFISLIGYLLILCIDLFAALLFHVTDKKWHSADQHMSSLAVLKSQETEFCDYSR